MDLTESSPLIWDGSTPRSKLFDDIYFSTENGLAETEHVFLKNNQLKERWLNLKKNDSFIIMETGFGTGLNFLATCQLWNNQFKNNPKKKPNLHFISFEKYPLEKPELAKAHTAFPELNDYSLQLHQNYPKLIEGFHRLHFTNNIQLTLVFDDASSALEKINPDFKVDAWFFDGFSPSNNPELWSEELFNKSKTLNKHGTTFATFTSAGHVKRKLQSIGFECKKIKGFSHKREMLIGTFKENETTEKITAYTYQQKPWLIMPPKKTIQSKQKVAIIGAGLAGAWTAYKLAQKDIEVSVFDSADHIASEASGNSRGATYFTIQNPSEKASVAQRFYLHAYLYATRELNQLLPDHPEIWQNSGLIQLLTEKEEKENFENSHYPELARFIDKMEVSQISQSPQHFNGIYFPDAGSVNPVRLCKHLLNQPGITVYLKQKITAFNYHEDKKHWALENTDGLIFTDFSTLVLANSHAANSYQQTQHLPLYKVRGQSTQIKSSSKSENLKTVICANGYLTPAFDGAHTIGSTFDPRNQNTEVLDADNQSNLNYLKSSSADFYQSLEPVVIKNAKAALRCQTPDMLPMLGQVCNYQSFMRDYTDIGRGQIKKNYPATEYFPGLYINSAHASRGLISTPYCAEILVNEIFNEPLACEKEIKEALSPTRFYLRQLKKNN